MEGSLLRMALQVDGRLSILPSKFTFPRCGVPPLPLVFSFLSRVGYFEDAARRL